MAASCPLPTTYRNGRVIARHHAGAWRKGYVARLDGAPASRCPYDRWATARYGGGRCGPTWERSFATAWLDGWETAAAGLPVPGSEGPPDSS